jgi:hypothetical protein
MPQISQDDRDQPASSADGWTRWARNWGVNDTTYHRQDSTQSDGGQQHHPEQQLTYLTQPICRAEVATDM